VVEVDLCEAEEVAQEVHQEEEVDSHLEVEGEVEDSQGVAVVVDSHPEAVAVVREVEDSQGDAKCREYVEEIKLWVYGVLEYVCRYDLGCCDTRTSVQKMQKVYFLHQSLNAAFKGGNSVFEPEILKIKACLEN
jgi:hypothetical protein